MPQYSGVKKTRGRTIHWQVLFACWPARAMLVEGIGLHVKDILVSLVLSLMRKTSTNSYVYKTNFCLKHSKQTRVGPRSSGTRFLVIIKFAIKKTLRHN